MDTKKLRQKILDLAIHGKLVPQDPNDEPASVLLERIRAEKERLIAEGKIKRSKKSATSDTPHYENVPFEVPEGWCWVKIRDLCYYLGGYAFKSTQYVASSDNQVIRIGNVKDDKILLESQPVFITDDYAVTAESALLKNKDLLFTMTGTKGKRDYFKTSLVRVGKKRLFLNQRVGCLRSYSTHVYMEYLCLAMKQTCVLDAIFQTETGNVSQGNIGSENTLDLLIPLPPLNEQKRIVQRFQDCISDIDSVELNTIELKKVIERLKSKILDFAIHGKLVPQDPTDEPASELLKRINPKAVTSCDNPHYENTPYNIPQSWCWQSLKSISSQISTKEHQIPTKEVERSGLIPVVSQSTQIIDGYSNDSGRRVTDIPIILFGDHTRVVKYLDFEFVVGADGTKLIKSHIFDKYLYYWVKATAGHIRDRGYGRHFALLNQEPVPIPPLLEQKRIVARIDELFLLLDLIEKSLQA